MTLATLTTLTLMALGQPPIEAKQLYAKILKQHVSAGLVDYQGLNKNRDPLDTLLGLVAAAKVPAKKSEALAFYIDAYNALVLRSVLDAGIPTSVLTEKTFFTAVKHTVAGKSLSLDELEKKVINPLADDPRTHMVLVCAALGCPVLEERPYSGSPLDARLERATARYLRSAHGARVGDGSLALSKIFQWYTADFGGEQQVVAFVRSRLTKAQNARLGKAPKVSYFEYDWQLNRK